MDGNEKKDAMEERFEIGFDNQASPKLMIVKIPVALHAEAGMDGLHLFYGRCRYIEATGSKLIKDLYQRKQQQNGLIKPNGKKGFEVL